MIVFGGRSVNNRFNDLFQLNLSKGNTQYTWNKIIPKNQNIPSKRAGCTLTEWKDQLYLFGGFDGKFESNELWIFNLKTSIWVECQFVNIIPNRVGLHSCVKIGNNEELKLYTLGGVSGDQIDDEYVKDFCEMIDCYGDTKINLKKSLEGNYLDVVIKFC
jgi:hypothetical protein